MRVGGRAIAGDFAQNFRVPFSRVFKRFQRQNRRAFTERQAVARGVGESAWSESNPAKVNWHKAS
jgi:hypothetical protein